MNKKSSIEQLELDLIIWFSFTGVHFPIEIKNSFERAKAIHKEEMKEAHLIADHYPRGYEFDKWYNETFGQEGNDDYYNELFKGHPLSIKKYFKGGDNE
jgi:hypothetical protein